MPNPDTMAGAPGGRHGRSAATSSASLRRLLPGRRADPRFGRRNLRLLHGQQQVRLVGPPAVADAEIDGTAVLEKGGIFLLVHAAEDGDRADIVAEWMQ